MINVIFTPNTSKKVIAVKYHCKTEIPFRILKGKNPCRRKTLKSLLFENEEYNISPNFWMTSFDTLDKFQALFDLITGCHPMWIHSAFELTNFLNMSSKTLKDLVYFWSQKKMDLDMSHQYGYIFKINDYMVKICFPKLLLSS